MEGVVEDDNDDVDVDAVVAADEGADGSALSSSSSSSLGSSSASSKTCCVPSKKLDCESCRTGKIGMLARDVVREVSPGTLMEDSMEAAAHSFILWW